MFKKGEKLITRTVSVFILEMICCVLWGSAFPFIKIGYSLFGITSKDTASQILFAGVRFSITGVLTVLIFSIMNKHLMLPHKNSWLNIGKLGFMQTIVQYLFFYIGLSNTTSTKSSIIGGIAPFITILIACFLFGQERFTKPKLLGSLLGFAGIIIINLDFINVKTSISLTGEGFIFISNVASAMSSSMIKNYSKNENPVLLTGYQFAFGGIVMTAVGIAMGGRLNFANINAVFIILYLAMLSAIATSLWSVLLKYNPVSKVSIFGFMIPVFGVILSALLLGELSEAFNLQSITSLILVSAGIIIINKFVANGGLKARKTASNAG